MQAASTLPRTSPIRGFSDRRAAGRLLVPALACLLASTTASAQPEGAVAGISPECIAYVSADGEEELLWHQLLSLAACIQGATVANITRAEQLGPTVERLASELATSMMIYIYVIEHAPVPGQLRATYQLGMSFVALAIRARASIRVAGLRAQLEPRLVHATNTARIAFMLIDQAVRDDPTLESDAVARYMIRDARLKLAQLGGPLDIERTSGEMVAKRVQAIRVR